MEKLLEKLVKLLAERCPSVLLSMRALAERQAVRGTEDDKRTMHRLREIVKQTAGGSDPYFVMARLRNLQERAEIATTVIDRKKAALLQYRRQVRSLHSRVDSEERPGGGSTLMVRDSGSMVTSRPSGEPEVMQLADFDTWKCTGRSVTAEVALHLGQEDEMSSSRGHVDEIRPSKRPDIEPYSSSGDEANTGEAGRKKFKSGGP